MTICRTIAVGMAGSLPHLSRFVRSTLTLLRWIRAKATGALVGMIRQNENAAPARVRCGIVMKSVALKATERCWSLL